MDLVQLFMLVPQNKFVKKNLDEGLVYSIFLVIAYFGATFFSDIRFSALITLASAVQCLGFCLLRLKIRKQRGVEGISSRTLQMFAVGYAFRLYSTLQYNGYLPVDRTGDWVYQVVDCAALAVIVSILYAIHATHEHTYDKDSDTCVIGFFILGCTVLSCFVHPHLNNRAIPDVAWTCALYFETVAMIPQLWLLTKKGGEVESLAGHYIACVFISRLLMITFWVNSYSELLPRGATYNIPGYGVLGAQLLQVVLYMDFMWVYAKSIRNNSKMILPVQV